MMAGRANVTMLPLQPLVRLNDLLNAADIHILPQRASAADLMMPSRLSAMLSSGRPVIATAHPGTQVAQIVEGRGIAVPAEDAPTLHAAVLRLVENEEERLCLGLAAREYAVKHLGKQQVLEQFESDLETLISQF
jgi:colanic acid biosynthesis glycosyl transferase WcaI